jgi:phosphoglycerate dehydrogenase-like enzyme
MDKFRVALSGDFRKPDGRPTYPSFDVAPLASNPQVGMLHGEDDNGTMPAKGLAGCDALILLVPRFDRTSIPADGKLAVVARFGVGYDSVDVPACTAAGIALGITPDGIRRPVAVSIITFILALSQKLLIKDRLTRQGPTGWNQRSGYMGEGVVGRTFGQLGIGNIGAEAFRLAKPFEMKLIAHDPYADPKVAAGLGVELVGLEQLFRRADFLSVSVPLSEATRHLVDAERLALMKPTAYVINTSRGPTVDQKALHAALAAGKIAGAALDVFETEPCPADEPLLKLDNVIVTPPSRCWTDQCFAGNGAADVEIVLSVMRGEVPKGLVNKEIVESPVWRAKLDGFRQRFAG